MQSTQAKGKGEPPREHLLFCQSSFFLQTKHINVQWNLHICESDAPMQQEREHFFFCQHCTVFLNLSKILWSLHINIFAKSSWCFNATGPMHHSSGVKRATLPLWSTINIYLLFSSYIYIYLKIQFCCIFLQSDSLRNHATITTYIPGERKKTKEIVCFSDCLGWRQAI